MHPKADESGQALWLVIIVLGSLAQLAILSLGQAAASGFSVRSIEAYWQRELVVEHIAEQLQRLPLLRVSASDQQALWHPLGASMRSGCATEARQSWTQTPCQGNEATVDHQARWAWQLERDAQSQRSWPGVVTQRYRLRIRSVSATGQVSHWQLDYQQRSLP